MGFFIFALILFIIAAILHITKDNKEQKIYEENIDKKTEQKFETEFSSPHLKKDAETQKWLYVYDSMEQLKQENIHLKDELKEIHSKLTLIWLLAVIVIVFYVLFFIILGSAGLGFIGLMQTIVELIK